MKKIISLAFAALLTLQGLSAQVKQSRSVSNYTAICVGSAIKVIVTLSDTESLVFDAEEGAQPKLKAEVKNGGLFISCTGDCNSKKEIIAYVTAKELKGIIVNEAASLRITNVLKAERLAVTASGAASVDLNVETDDLSTVAEGASTIAAKGHTKSLRVAVKGASSFKGKDVVAGDVTVSASGASNVKLNASGTLNAKASGASSIIYAGEPKSIMTDIQDASTVKKA